MANAKPDEEAIFNAARQIEGQDARLLYLRQACGEDSALQTRVAGLLRVYDQNSGFLQVPAPGTRELVELPPPEGPGTTIGPYRLVEKLGEGGMGYVYLADQDRPVRRQVAVKIIRPGLDSRLAVARFEAERQALALLDHPNVARIFDAGSIEDSAGAGSGRPYFVMELVRGVPITRFCDEHRLTVRERLELFVPVCRAIQHAHQKAIVHRDIKPSNILVARHDGRPVPKVIDFGVAKAMGARLTEQTLSTEIGLVVGTLEYMSPEQAGAVPVDVDTRSDVYSLGVLLYELMTGTTPLAAWKGKDVPLSELLRVIREEEPARPSARLGTVPGPAEVAANRGVEVSRLRRQVRGELDWIAMRCLEKDRARRYASAEDVARDVERHLAGEPVEAGPPSAAYRLRKFARRNRGLLAGVAAVGLALIAGTVVSSALAIRALRAEKSAGQEAAVARAVNDFFQNSLLAQASLHTQAQSGHKPDRNITVRTLLDRASETIAGKFDAQPLVEANIRNTMGVAYSQLGEFAKAEGHFRRARELYLAVLGPDDLRGLRATNNLANACLEQRRPEEARPLYEEVVAVARRVFGPDDPETLGPMNNLADLFTRTGRLEEARQMHEDILAARRRVLGAEDAATAQSLNNLATVLRLLGRPDEAQPLQEEALAIQRRVLGKENPETLASMYNAALGLTQQGRWEQALPRFDELLPAFRRVLGPDDFRTLEVLNGLAWQLTITPQLHYRNPARAVELATEATRHAPKNAGYWNTLGVAHYRAGDWKNAAAALEKSEELAPGRFLGQNGFFLAMAYWNQGAQAKAGTWYDRAAAWTDKNQPADAELLTVRKEAARLLGRPVPKSPSAKNGR